MAGSGFPSQLVAAVIFLFLFLTFSYTLVVPQYFFIIFKRIFPAVGLSGVDIIVKLS